MARKKEQSRNGDGGNWSERSNSHYRPFAGQPSGSTPLRVSFTREAYADLNHHTRASLEDEVGGILVGHFCYDDNGDYLEVRGIIPASETRQGKSHVTFTHDTWDRIHADLAASFKGMDIVGWYHTHPGFGVEFSDMDAFVHGNFFSSSQVAIVQDPVAGDTAGWATVNGRQRYLDRIWVDAREIMLKVPPAVAGGDAGANGGAAPQVQRKLEDLETTVGQLMRSLDQYRSLTSRVIFGGTLLITSLAAAAILYAVIFLRTERIAPPKDIGWVPIPVQVGDDVVLLGAKMYMLEIPAALRPMLQEQGTGTEAETGAAEGVDARRPAAPDAKIDVRNGEAVPKNE